MSFNRYTPWYLRRGRPHNINYPIRRCNNIFNQNPFDNICEFAEYYRRNDYNAEFSFDRRGRIRHISINRANYYSGRIRRNWTRRLR